MNVTIKQTLQNMIELENKKLDLKKAEQSQFWSSKAQRLETIKPLLLEIAEGSADESIKFELNEKYGLAKFIFSHSERSGMIFEVEATSDEEENSIFMVRKIHWNPQSYSTEEPSLQTKHELTQNLLKLIANFIATRTNRG